ncbi:Peroxiredoxin tpx1 [Schizosaccharomyces pombe]|uniref:Peroxiredoxin tpx1 n=1 Tax=Schizosaccharomyces pombe (strain 972 / ATCC 24843) TaxID=284812 RepID=TPX1_SCHPO|nr:thioredoxin peroxidase Tpx1 [Schizosaccharomyces pombe]O74887.1 RecName: Full=Peroxiredoxin tpx1; AltName: Full=Thioredoxin peroxidase; Short=TPx; AltName: Full=Thioredoxin-dependent peroxiredoxin tpx1 [Schizosaccharomyces pombe 972h-]AAC71013.1 thioredoxin peroxidase [Schizosaccharomyces pombe]CAA21182.1 thioredoxin peroxidase Tpx1 [Schizosaccharomyces pombe]|eukprot:NP_588430.1 thioredoxin peroxidase Tpx1 [Schizosaccharomyces pombe]
MSLQIGKPAPDFKGTAVVNGAFEEIKLADYKGKWVFLGFYPLDFTFVCPTEIVAFSEAASKFAERNAQVILTSTDSEYSHLAFINTPRKEGGLGGINIPLLADPSHKVSRDYGVLIEDAGVAFRGLFLIDPKGVLRQITINDLPVGRSVDEALRLLDAFQFVEEHGEVCPANWHKGSDTIDTKNPEKYFSKH